MVDRPSSGPDHAPACPFVALDDDRDERSDRPDHRHRCYADTPPAPRALAHQEAFCLAPAFPTCPTFQDWARREAARTRLSVRGPAREGVRDGSRDGGRAAAEAPPPRRSSSVDDDERSTSETDTERDGRPTSGRRDWASPPPWVHPDSGTRRTDEDDEGGIGESGTAGDPAAGLAASRWLADARPGDEGMDLAADAGAAAPGFLASRVGRSGERSIVVDPGSTAPTGRAAGRDERPARLARQTSADRPSPARPSADHPAAADDRRRPDLTDLVARIRAGTRGGSRGADRPLEDQARESRRAPREDVGPSWERPRRFEAYPTLRTRVPMPTIPRLALATIALVVAAFVLFMAPAFLLTSNQPSANATPTPSPIPSTSAAPTPTPAPTPVTYTVKAGDTIERIAAHFGVTQAQLLQANPQIKDPNKIAIGQVIVVPGAAASQVIVSGPTGSSPPPSVAPSPS